MDSIYQNLQNPEWWFTGIFFVVIGIVISKLFKAMPVTLKGISRKIQKNHFSKIKNHRQDSNETHYQITSENRYFFGFLVFGALYLFLFSLSPFRVLLKDHFWFVMMLTTPLYVSEIMWLNKKAYIQSLIKSAKKLKTKRNCVLKEVASRKVKKVTKNNKRITRHLKQGLA